MDDGVGEAGAIEECQKFIGGINRHAVDYLGPDRGAVKDFNHDSETTTRLEDAIDFLETVGEVGPEIDGFYRGDEVEHGIGVWEFLGRALDDEDLLVECAGVDFPGLVHGLCGDVNTMYCGSLTMFE